MVASAVPLILAAIAVVDAGGLRLRDAPGTHGKVVAYLARGQVVQTTGLRKGPYCEVIAAGVTGFVACEKLRSSENAAKATPESNGPRPPRNTARVRPSRGVETVDDAPPAPAAAQAARTSERSVTLRPFFATTGLEFQLKMPKDTGSRQQTITFSPNQPVALGLGVSYAGFGVA